MKKGLFLLALLCGTSVASMAATPALPTTVEATALTEGAAVTTSEVLPSVATHPALTYFDGNGFWQITACGHYDTMYGSKADADEYFAYMIAAYCAD